MKAIVLFFIILFCFSFKHNNNKLIPVSYKIYCWSFFSCDEKRPPFTLINTQVGVDVSRIIKKKYLIFDDKNPAHASSFYNLFIKGRSSLNESKAIHTDSRFVIVLNYNGHDSDTLIYRNESSFCLNDKIVIHYNFKVLDSVRKYSKIKCFACKHP